MEKIIAREVYSSTQAPSPFGFRAPTPAPPSDPVEPKEPEVIDNQDVDDEYVDPEYDNYDDDGEGFNDTPPEEPEDPDTDEGPEGLDEAQVSSSLFEAFKSLGFISEDQEDIKADNVTDFLIKYEKAKAAKLEEAAKANLEATYSKEVLNYVDFLMKGGSPEAISSFYQLYNLPIDDDYSDVENRKALILAMYKDKEVPEKRAQSLYNTLYDDNEDLEEAKIAKQYFKEKHDGQMAEVQKKEQAELEAEAKKNEQLQSDLKTMLKTRKLSDLELNEKEAKDLESYMFTPTVITDVLDPTTGTVYKGKVSQYYDDYQKFFSNPESLIKLAKFIKSGGVTKPQDEEIQERVSTEILKGLNGFGSRITSKGTGKQQPKRKNAFLT